MGESPRRPDFWLVAPYATWMALLMALPSAPWAYAARTLATSFVLVPAVRALAAERARISPAQAVRALLWGVAVGLLVLVVWVWPEQFAWYRKWCILGKGGTDAIAESGALMIALRLVGSAFVISVAEELFFRRWLIRFAGFWWMVALFAVEHDRWLVGAAAGVLYGLLYLRKGLLAALVAHAVTNLALGVYVLKAGAWQFW